MGGLHRLRSFRLSPQGRSLLLFGLSTIGFVLLAKTLLGYGIEGAGGGGGIDAIAYWTAASNVRDGQPLYLIPEGSFAAYAYPPAFAQVLVPFSYLPMTAFVWLWRGLELAALRFTVGSWTRTGLALLLPPVLAEIDAGNVHLLMAAVCALAMRGTGTAIAPAALLKFATIPLAPLQWRLDRRGLVAGLLVAAGLVIVSLLLQPAAWADYIRFIQGSEFPSGWYNVAESVPLPLRLALSVATAFAALKWIRLAPVAVTLAYPILWFHALSTLVAVVAPLSPQRAREPRQVPERVLAQRQSVA
jgi:hypothetical protein